MGGGRAGSVDTHGISGNGRYFAFGLKREELNMKEMLSRLDPLNSIIYREIIDGSDVMSNSSSADDDEVKLGKGHLE